MSLERAKKHWKKYGLEDKIIEFDTSSATVEEAAKALGCSPGEIAKTLSFLVEGKPILIVAAGDVKIDNSKYKAFFHQKAKMIPVDDVEKMIGHKVGGVCPFGILEGVEVYLDRSLQKYDVIYPTCGISHSAVKLTIRELEETSCYQEWINVWKEEYYGWN